MEVVVVTVVKEDVEVVVNKALPLTPSRGGGLNSFEDCRFDNM